MTFNLGLAGAKRSLQRKGLGVRAAAELRASGQGTASAVEFLDRGKSHTQGAEILTDLKSSQRISRAKSFPGC